MDDLDEAIESKNREFRSQLRQLGLHETLTAELSGCIIDEAQCKLCRRTCTAVCLKGKKIGMRCPNCNKTLICTRIRTKRVPRQAVGGSIHAIAPRSVPPTNKPPQKPLKTLDRSKRSSKLRALAGLESPTDNACTSNVSLALFAKSIQK